MAETYRRIVLASRPQGWVREENFRLETVALTEHVAAGRLKYRETVADGLAAAPAAFIGLLKGQNIGKQLVRL
jgi:NADPH-dependent curcumin reductase